jgi:hypothetical protein
MIKPQFSQSIQTLPGKQKKGHCSDEAEHAVAATRRSQKLPTPEQ